MNPRAIVTGLYDKIRAYASFSSMIDSGIDDDLEVLGDAMDERQDLIDFVNALDVRLHDKQTWFLQDNGLWMKRGHNEEYTTYEVCDELLYVVKSVVGLLDK